MTISLGLFIALSVVAVASDSQSSLQALNADEAISLFKRTCFDPFPDPARFRAVVMEPALEFQKQPETPSQARQPGDAWFSPTARLTYSDAEWLPRNLPSPQCSLTLRLAGTPSHIEVAAALVTVLDLPAGKVGKPGIYAQSQWDLPGRGSDKWRLFMTTQGPLPEGYELRLSLLNLRAKKK